MELLFLFLGFLMKPLVVFGFLIVAIAMLDAATQPTLHRVGEKESLGRKKNGAEEANLDDHGLKGSATKKSKKKKRVDLVDDVVVRKANDVEVSEKLKGVELCELMSEKIGFFANLSEKRLIVERGEESMIVEEVDDAVVARKVYHLDGSDKHIEEPESTKDMSEKVGSFNSSLEEGSGVTLGDSSKNVMKANQYEARGVDAEESEVMILGENSIGGWRDVNLMKDEKTADGSKSVGLQVGALSTEATEEKNEVGRINNYCGAKGGPSVTGGLGGAVNVAECSDAAGERVTNTAKLKALDSDNELKLLNDDVEIDESDTAKCGREANGAKLLEQVLERRSVHDEEDEMVLTKDNISTYNRDLGHNREDLDRKVVDVTINRIVQIDQSNAAAGEIVVGKAELSKEEFEREAVGVKTEYTPADLNKVINFEESLVSDNVSSPPVEKGADDNGADDDDDWEGVERSELEKIFAEAVNYVECGKKKRGDHSASLSNDVQMLLHGLHKLAVEGPCHVPQPMVLKVTARAKWNAWQNLGSMSPEAAMEEYIKILADADPGWTQHSTAVPEGDMHNSLEAQVGDVADKEAKLELGGIN